MIKNELYKNMQIWLITKVKWKIYIAYIPIKIPVSE